MRYLILASLLLAASLQAETISRKNVGFSAIFPEGNGWSKVEENIPGQGVMIWMQKQESTSSLAVVRSVFPLKGTKEEQYEGYRKGVAEKCDELVGSEAIEVDSWPAYRVVGKKKISGRPFYVTSIVATKGSTVYTITRVCASTAPDEDRDFSAFMKSIRLGK